MGEAYYLLKSGSLIRSSDSLILRNETEKIEIPLETVDVLMVFGNVTFSSPSLGLLAEKNIPTILYSERGWYISSIMPEDYLQSGTVVSKQVEHHLDISKRLIIARKFVLGAARNMRKVTIRGKLGRLQIPVNQINSSTNIPELMGVEGNLHIKYLEILDQRLPSRFKIIERTRRPPLNYTNSMMSYLYSVLYGIISAETFSTHLSPSISYLHELSSRRSSLSLDIAEMFKPIFCDRVILKLINLKMISETDFDENNGVYLNSNGKRKLLRLFDEKMRETVYVGTLRRKVSNRHLIRLELYKLEKHVLGDTEYKPYVSNI